MMIVMINALCWKQVNFKWKRSRSPRLSFDTMKRWWKNKYKWNIQTGQWSNCFSTQMLMMKNVKPCHIIVAQASNHDKCLSIRYSTCKPPRMCQRKGCSSWGENNQKLLILYLAQSPLWTLHRCCRPATQLSQEGRAAPRPCVQISPDCDFVF